MEMLRMSKLSVAAAPLTRSRPARIHVSSDMGAVTSRLKIAQSSHSSTPPAARGHMRVCAAHAEGMYLPDETGRDPLASVDSLPLLRKRVLVTGAGGCATKRGRRGSAGRAALASHRYSSSRPHASLARLLAMAASHWLRCAVVVDCVVKHCHT
jgi:hypothetical protein